MSAIDIGITGGFYIHPSQNTNYQRCVNMYPFVSGPDGKGKQTLLQRAGKSILTNLGVSTIRGLTVIANTIYVVGDNKLFSVVVNLTNFTANVTTLGTINNFSGLVSMTSNPDQVIIVNGSTTGYIYSYINKGTVTPGAIGGHAGNTYNLTINGTIIYNNFNVSTALTLAVLATQINIFTPTTNITATVTDTTIQLSGINNNSIQVIESGGGFVSGTNGITISNGVFSSGTLNPFQIINVNNNYFGANIVTYMDGYFIYSTPNTNTMYASALNDGTIWNPLDFANAEYMNNNIVGLASKNRNLWVFCNLCVEPWYDAANESGFPFSERVSTELNIGCLAPYSIVNLNNAFIWLDSRKFIVISVPSPLLIDATSGNDAQVISTDAIHNEIDTYGDLSNAVGSKYYERGHLFYQITFPSVGKTWVFDMNTQIWHERSYYDSGTDAFTQDLSIYYCDVNGTSISAGLSDGNLYVTDPSYFDDAGTPIYCTRTTAPYESNFRLIGIDRLEIKCNTGNTPQGLKPYIAMRYSNDDGHTWSYGQKRDLGSVGEYNKRLQWNRLGSSFQWLFEFVVVAPMNWALIEAAADIAELEDY